MHYGVGSSSSLRLRNEVHGRLPDALGWQGHRRQLCALYADKAVGSHVLVAVRTPNNHVFPTAPANDAEITLRGILEDDGPGQDLFVDLLGELGNSESVRCALDHLGRVNGLLDFRSTLELAGDTASVDVGDAVVAVERCGEAEIRSRCILNLQSRGELSLLELHSILGPESVRPHRARELAVRELHDASAGLGGLFEQLPLEVTREAVLLDLPRAELRKAKWEAAADRLRAVKLGIGPYGDPLGTPRRVACDISTKEVDNRLIGTTLELHKWEWSGGVKAGRGIRIHRSPGRAVMCHDSTPTPGIPCQGRPRCRLLALHPAGTGKKG
mmetsp:Transcript_122596/g.261631  ORF Transcript_122596/g.261631 Transcript_122596/m.261631 type:complete len:328 (+) Transcript_122596:34-1017(+)